MREKQDAIPEEMYQLLQKICQRLLDKKGRNILTLDVRGICTVADYFIIAEGNVDRHVQALASHVFDEMAAHHRKPYHVEGKEFGDWVVLDYGDIMVHLFTQEMREKYMLEQVWKEGSVVDIPLKL